MEREISTALGFLAWPETLRHGACCTPGDGPFGMADHRISLDRALMARLPIRGNGIEVAYGITPFLSSRQPTAAEEITSRAGLPDGPLWRTKDYWVYKLVSKPAGTRRPVQPARSLARMSRSIAFATDLRGRLILYYKT